LAGSRVPGALGANHQWIPARTPGPLGLNDQGDPTRCSILGDTPGTLGLRDGADPTLPRLTDGLRMAAPKLTLLPDGTALRMPLAASASDQRRAPWMSCAEDEARAFKGETEDKIEKTTNFATEVHTGQTTIVGNDHPWCAAFVNWCLMKAGYVIENDGYADRVAAKGRAHGFYEVSKDKVKKGEKEAPLVRNPLYVQIDEPLFGAIAMVTNRGGHGHHVGFVYSKPRDNHVVLLGGNQSDRIRFSEFNIKPIQPTKVTKQGKTVTIPGKPDHLMFFVPASYEAYAKSDMAPLATDSADDLNKKFGIAVVKGAREDATR